MKYHAIPLTGIGLLVAGAVTAIWLSHVSQPGPVSSQASVKTPLHIPTALPTQSSISSLPKNKQFQQFQLTKYLTVEAALLGITDNMSLYFKDQNSEVTVDPERSWIPASTIKAYVAIEAFRQRRVGLIDFGQTVTIQPENVVPTELETDEFPRLRAGTQVTIEQLVDSMIIQSDNTAYNTLMDILDRRSINRTLKDLGMTETVAGEKLNLDDQQFQQDLQVPGRQANTTTVKDLATLFNLLYSKQIADSDEILSVFKRQKINSMIPALLPAGIAVAHKTGDWAPIYHDGGIIYKPADPFTLVVFTNANDVNAIAQIAKVAYYQNADSVGMETGKSVSSAVVSPKHIYPRVYLAASPLFVSKAVLGEATALSSQTTYTVQAGDSLWKISERFYGTGDQWESIARRNYITDPSSLSEGTKLIVPLRRNNAGDENVVSPKITAADLGITTRDLTVDTGDVGSIADAKIMPGSIFYGTKILLENLAIQASGDTPGKIHAYLEVVKNRLSEIKTLSAKGDTGNVQALFDASENALKKATDTAQSSTNPQLYLLQIKQLSDLHYAVLARNIRAISRGQKEKIIDTLYLFYKRNQREVQPAVQANVSANPIQQEPIIGTVVKTSGNTATIKFDNGATKDMLLTAVTSTRDFHSASTDASPSLAVGSRIAVIGQTTRTGNIIPTFILHNIPKALPGKVQGTVLEINSKNDTMEIEDQKGKVDHVVINDATSIKAKDTNVTIEGIKAGSQVSVVGETQKTTSITSSQTPSSVPGRQPAAQGSQPGSPVDSFKATSITVTKNSSGVQEKVDVVQTDKTQKDTKKPADEPKKPAPVTLPPVLPTGSGK